VPAREFNLKAYAIITWHNDPASPGLEPRLANHHSQAVCTTTLAIALPGQAYLAGIYYGKYQEAKGHMRPKADLDAWHRSW